MLLPDFTQNQDFFRSLFSPCGMLLGISTWNQDFFRNLFSPALFCPNTSQRETFSRNLCNQALLLSL